MERIMTVVATCKLQKRNILDYLTSAVTCYLKKSASPSLLLTNSLDSHTILAFAA